MPGKNFSPSLKPGSAVPGLKNSSEQCYCSHREKILPPPFSSTESWIREADASDELQSVQR